MQTGERRRFTRAMKFGLVGAAGFAIQMMALAGLTAAGWKPAAATALAVELAVLHNFCWHESWTWRSVSTGRSWMRRFVRFHAATGLVSVAGNLVVTTAAINVLGLGPIMANAVAVAAMAVGNFHLADRWIFTEQRGFEF